MKFLVDAQLPKRLCELLRLIKTDCLHTLDLPDKNSTGDDEIIKIAEQENRIVVTKDNDFLRSHILQKQPKKLLLVNTGNISNKFLLDLFKENISLIINFFEKKNFIELTKKEVIVHD